MENRGFVHGEVSENYKDIKPWGISFTARGKQITRLFTVTPNNNKNQRKRGYILFAVFYHYSCFLEIPVGLCDTKKLDNVSNVNQAKEQITANANMGMAEMSLFSAPSV